MKIFITYISVILACLIIETSYAADQSGIGAGIIVGEPTGLSLKYNKFAGGIAWSIDDYLHIHFDYWFYNADLVKRLNWFIGGGLKFKIFDDHDNGRDHDNDSDDNSTGVGLRIPVGIQYFIIPEFEVFAEIVPGIYLVPDTDFDMDAGIGARYYF
jgi:hypothetical protein